MSIRTLPQHYPQPQRINFFSRLRRHHAFKDPPHPIGPPPPPPPNPARANRPQGKILKPPSAAPSHRSNAPIKTESRSILSNLIALLSLFSSQFDEEQNPIGCSKSAIDIHSQQRVTPSETRETV